MSKPRAMNRFRLACMRYTRLLLPISGCLVIVIELNPVIGPKSILNVSIAIIFLSLAHYSMTWAINSEALESSRQKLATRLASRDLLVGAILMGLASIDLISSTDKQPATIHLIISIYQAIACCLGLFWGLFGTDRLIRASIAECGP